MIRRAVMPADLRRAAELIHEYIAWLPFELDFQDYEAELADLESHYRDPAGALFLAFGDGELAVGVVGIRRYSDGVAELKRMFVRPEGRGMGLGRALAERAIGFARSAGYAAIRLDSDENSMPEANHLYERLGFVDIARYRSNDLPCARFMELRL